MHVATLTSDLPFHEYARQHLAGSTPKLELFPPPHRVAQVGFAIGHEGAIALLDDTIRKNARSGLLLTTHALYFLKDGRRLDLGLVSGPVQFPRGHDEAGFVETTQGPFAFPALHHLPPTRETLVRMVALVIAYRSGDRSAPLTERAARGPIGAACAHFLFSSSSVLPAHLVPPPTRDSFRSLLRGLEHARGEEVLAVIDEGEGKGDGVVLTDRALYARAKDAEAPNQLLFVPYDSISAVYPKKVMFGHGVMMVTSNGPREVVLTQRDGAAEPLAQYLGALSRLPPSARVEPRPIGVDAPTRRFVDALGLDPTIAADVLGRAALERVTTEWARAKHDGWYLSALSLEDFRAVLGYALGAAFDQQWDGRVLTLGFPLNAASGTGRAIASSAVGLALYATVGLGWVSVPTGPKFHAVRVRACELAGATGFRVTGFGPNGEGDAPSLVDAVDTKLLALEAEVMKRRVRLGLGLPLAALLTQDLPDAPAPPYRPSGIVPAR